MPDDAFIGDDFEQLLARHREIQRMLPGVWNAFFARFGRLTPVQLATLPIVVSGQNVLVTAPTAGGKTEAVMAPLCERLIREHWKGLSVLLVTPTRALVNDLFARLEVPCMEAGVSIGRKTADHMKAGPIRDNVLVTTPESLESLLTFRRETLAALRAVAIDEIHLLDGTPRGDHLRLLLARLRAYLAHVNQDSGFTPQTVAMSATVPDAARTAAAYLGTGAVVVQVPGQRAIEGKVLAVAGSDAERAKAAMRATSRFDGVSKVLVFVNSRKQVDAGVDAYRVGPFADARVFGHHGSLSKAEREETEEAFKSSSQAVCVATSTLEVGIDIGDVDLVVCMDPPFSLSGFLQRLGRGCRRRASATRVLCVARDRASELMFDGLLQQAGLGLPATPVAPFRRSVLVQQILAYLRQVPNQRRTFEQFERVFVTDTAPSVPATLVRGVLDEMTDCGLLDAAAGVYTPAAAGRDFIESGSIFTNISSSSSGISLVDVETGAVVANVRNLPDTDAVRVAGRSWDVLPGTDDFVVAVRGGSQHGDAPGYQTRSLPYAADVGTSVARRMGAGEGRLYVLERADGLSVMTWLGRLANECLAAGLTSVGFASKASSFAVKAPARLKDGLLETLATATRALEARNPLGSMRVERFADLGPHVRLLTEGGLEAAKMDWLDVARLRAWVDGLRDVEIIRTCDPRAADFAVLAKV